LIQYKKTGKNFLRFSFVAFVLLNVVAYFHAYKFTHFADSNLQKTKNPEKLTTVDKVKTLVFGVSNPKPTNKAKPTRFETVELQSNKKISCWYATKKYNSIQDSTKGTIILFHGYSAEKSTMLDKAEEFEKLHFNVLLVDFMGCGASEGNQTTLGYMEALEVKTAVEFLNKKGEKNIYLFGTSMGAVAILKSVADYNLNVKAIIIECPFGSMYQTTCARFNTMGVPTFPMAGLLVFWGGVQNGFWAFGHNPTQYAKQIKCPTLVLYGQQDKSVSKQEIDDIYKNLASKKVLKTYKNAGHENYLIKYKSEWIADVDSFLRAN
jgi:uncharacterized protein